MNNLFEFPPEPSKPQGKQNSNQLPEYVSHSHVVSVPSNTSGRDINYARLSTRDHDHLTRNVAVLKDIANVPAVQRIMARNSGLWGSQLGRQQTYGEVLDGIRGKLSQRHPIVCRRQGQDLSIKQLNALNALVEAINELVGEQVIEPVPVPA